MRPADAIGHAVLVGKIAPGELEGECESLARVAAKIDHKGGQNRAANMTPELRAEIAKAAAVKRWSEQA